jgi:hypothetical protein
MITISKLIANLGAEHMDKNLSRTSPKRRYVFIAAVQARSVVQAWRWDEAAR